jgi:hypothetical protein
MRSELKHADMQRGTARSGLNKIVIVLFAVSAIVVLQPSALATGVERPFIWVKPSDRQDILQKIEGNEWANRLFETLRARAEEAAPRTLAERREALLTLPLIWSEDKQAAPSITTYAGTGSQQRNGELRWGYPDSLQLAMMKGLQDGIDCGVLHYLTEEVKYAECAADILATFVNALSKTEVSESHVFNGGWIYKDNHLLEARVVGAQIPIIYDFVHSYLKNGGLVYDLASGELRVFDFDAAQDVFKTYVSLALNRGLLDSNWPVLESPSLVHNILALDDESERASMLLYFLEKDTDHQASLRMIAEMFKNPGDIWPESLNYSRHVTFLSIYVMTTLDRIYPDLRLGELYPNIVESLHSFYNLQFPNGDYPFFGDGHRHYEVEYEFHEMALQLALLNKNENQADMLSDFLSASIASGRYDRASLAQRRFAPSPYLIPLHLLWSVDAIDGDQNIDLAPPRPRTNHLPHAGMTIQRNISEERPEENSLMAFIAGGSYIHGHASGMDMELYGQGYVLGIDGGKGLYGTDSHENYYRLFAAHNTVISNGASGSRGGWINMGINRVEPVAVEPAAGTAGVSPKHSFATCRFFDEFNLVAPAEHQRTIALIRLSDSRGYYLDVFRARSDTPAEFHDYLYHNIGDTLHITSGGETLPMKPDGDRYQASDKIPWVYHEVYQHPGWHFFDDVRSSFSSEAPYEAVFTANRLGDQSAVMRALVPAGLSSEISQMQAPTSYGASEPYNEEPLPTFALRHYGEAWSNPFAVVYESYTDKPSIESVQRLMDDGEFKGVTVVSNADGRRLTQYVLMQESVDDEYVDEERGITFKGLFAVITAEEGGALLDTYIGSGHYIIYHGVTVNADEFSRAVYLENIRHENED